jgi:hypothetical protein
MTFFGHVELLPPTHAIGIFRPPPPSYPFLFSFQSLGRALCHGARRVRPLPSRGSTPSPQPPCRRSSPFGLCHDAALDRVLLLRGAPRSFLDPHLGSAAATWRGRSGAPDLGGGRPPASSDPCYGCSASTPWASFGFDQGKSLMTACVSPTSS